MGNYEILMYEKSRRLKDELVKLSESVFNLIEAKQFVNIICDYISNEILINDIEQAKER